VSFIPIGSYVLFTGILRSARLVSRDKELRKEFYKTAASQLRLLKTIGVTEMQKELIKSYKSVENRTHSLDKDSRYEKVNVREALHGPVDEMDKENVREMLHDVLTELYSKSKKNKNADDTKNNKD
jgi:hypothetical protein